MEDYKTLAKLRYEKHRQKEEEILKAKKIKEEEILKAEKIKELEQERKIINDNLMIDTIINEITVLIDDIAINYSADNILIKTAEILSIIFSNLELITEYHRIKEIQTSIINLINIINTIFENKQNRPNTDFVKQISEIISQITNVLELDIDIELMDTSGDAEFAKELEDNYAQERSIYDDIVTNELNLNYTENLRELDEMYIKHMYMH